GPKQGSGSAPTAGEERLSPHRSRAAAALLPQGRSGRAPIAAGQRQRSHRSGRAPSAERGAAAPPSQRPSPHRRAAAAALSL
ncbi:unnamed protein product, partial [Musa textilis]